MISTALLPINNIFKYNHIHFHSFPFIYKLYIAKYILL